ncbi:hypothetical protein MHB69_09440 [Bacillus sp. FSL K6-0994]|uniref:hypothetical protein n=1 Tax=Bacillus sp. FSL K6-0994 TaxID=2921457 RepID=UPI00315AF808
MTGKVFLTIFLRSHSKKSGRGNQKHIQKGITKKKIDWTISNLDVHHDNYYIAHDIS